MELEAYFSSVAKLLDCFVVVNFATKRSTGFGFITIDPSEDIDRFLKMNHVVEGARVIIAIAG